MKNKKGFTLIELLSVIVILAIIALIATPIIMNVIENSRKGSVERSAENYIDAVEVAVGTERIDGKVLDGEYTIQEDGSICPLLGCGIDDDHKVKIDMSGDKPSSGTIFIDNGLVTTDSTMTIKDYIVRYDETKKSYVAIISQKICTYVPETGTTSKTVGAKYTCHLDTDRTFYVLGDNASDSTKIDLLMDRNFTDEVVPTTLAWCIDGGRNNTTCKNINAKEEGTPLKHIQDVFGNNVTVSFPTTSQIAEASGETFNGSTINGLESWLYDYLNDTTHPVSEVKGYWSASPDDNNSLRAWYVYYTGYMYYKYNVNSTNDIGLRPVITILKSELN